MKGLNQDLDRDLLSRLFQIFSRRILKQLIKKMRLKQMMEIVKSNVTNG